MRAARGIPRLVELRAREATDDAHFGVQPVGANLVGEELRREVVSFTDARGQNQDAQAADVR
ncbi:MAG: hypothetical protein QOE91_94 [Gaiellaceae bacterium]|nr:hypothetical protein [Gaiellaceae bacterium]